MLSLNIFDLRNWISFSIIDQYVTCQYGSELFLAVVLHLPYLATRLGGFLLPPEVVSCSYLPEPGLRAHCVRLLREQWESEARHLASIPEEPIGCAHLSCESCIAHTRAHTHVHIIDYNIN